MSDFAHSYAANQRSPTLGVELISFGLSDRDISLIESFCCALGDTSRCRLTQTSIAKPVPHTYTELLLQANEYRSNVL